MSVGLSEFKQFLPVKGLKLGVAQAGVKKANHNDVVIMELCENATVAGVFTTNAFCAAPVHIAKKHLKNAATRYLMINTGNANAGTGEQGFTDALACCQALADAAGVNVEQVLPYSTGVIGEPLPADKIISALPNALTNLDEKNWQVASAGIMTTDTIPKGASREFEINGQRITLTGISKGAGMIKPNMATMLGFIATDAKISQELLTQLSRDCAETSFNRITIDGDTSTNDACMLIASGQGDFTLSSDDSVEYHTFKEALETFYIELAQAIVRDGEGATKFVTVKVEGALSSKEALDVAYTVAHSPLVKTALFACDANWGRILAAVGRAGVNDLDVNNIDVFLNSVCIVESGGRAASYTEEAGTAVMQEEEITIQIKLGRGEINEKIWTTDLSHEYVTINADYRT
jgi:glutamate N-acetyltransferase/amino-acid N-acetyltransferase